MIAIQQCQLKTGVCTRVGKQHIKRNGIGYYSCPECAKATGLRVGSPPICALCGEMPNHCEHTEAERLAAQQLKQEIIQGTHEA